MIEGISLHIEKRITNPKGDIFRGIKKSSKGFLGFGEMYFSTVAPGAIKGWKCHQRVTLNIVVPVGEVRFVLFDDRVTSKTKGCFNEIFLGTEDYNRLTVPPSIWMAFQGVGNPLNLLCNTIDEEHNPAESDNRDLEDIKFCW